MGTWGVGPLENDAALDVVHFWKGHLAWLREGSERTPEQIIDTFLEHSLGNTMDSGDVDTTSRLIALAALFLQEQLAIPTKAKGYFEEAINWELRPAALAEWDSAIDRQTALEDLLKRIGGKRRRLRKSKLFTHPALEYSSPSIFIKKLERWLELRKDHKGLDPAWEDTPRLWHVFERIMNNQLHDAPDDVIVKVTQLRLTMLAAFTGWVLELPDEEVVQMARRAAKQFTLIGDWELQRAKKYRMNTPAE